MRFLRFTLAVALLFLLSVANAEPPTIEGCACYQERFASDILEYDCYSVASYETNSNDTEDFSTVTILMSKTILGMPSLETLGLYIDTTKSQQPKEQPELSCYWHRLTPSYDRAEALGDLKTPDYMTCPDYTYYLHTLTKNKGKCWWSPL